MNPIKNSNRQILIYLTASPNTSMLVWTGADERPQEGLTDQSPPMKVFVLEFSQYLNEDIAVHFNPIGQLSHAMFPFFISVNAQLLKQKYKPASK